MWIVLPMKDCKCASCEKLREVVDEGGQLNMGRPDGLIHNPDRGGAVTRCLAFEDGDGRDEK